MPVMPGGGMPATVKQRAAVDQDGGMPGMPGGGMPPPMLGSGIIPPGPNPNPRFIDQNIYTQVGHALWTVLIAALGGALACWLFTTRQRLAS